MPPPAPPALPPLERFPDLDAKRRFLRSPDTHAGDPVREIETHMSWVYLAGERVLKLKKPVRYAFLDFSTVHARGFYCREEVRLNRRLAPSVYRGVLALQWHAGRLSLLPSDPAPTAGVTTDWLVSMTRLPAARMLDSEIMAGALDPARLDGLVQVLARFYRQVPVADVTPAGYVEHLGNQLALHRALLTQPRFGLPQAGPIIDRLESALSRHAGLLRGRVEAGCVVDGHGDLRPEHVCLVEPPLIIDCLEFDARLRQVDPFDELSFLGLECEMIGAPWVGPRLLAGCAAALGWDVPPTLPALYTAMRAVLRARLAMAHLLDVPPRLPERWPPLAARYLRRAGQALESVDRA